MARTSAEGCVGVGGIALSAGIYPLIGSLLHPAGSDMGDTMMLSLYVTLGVFLLIAVRNPSAHRSLIAFAAWSSFAHAVAMSILGLEIPSQRAGFLVGSAVLVVSSAGESHPRALSEPYVNLSAHTAPAVEPRRTPICQ